MEKIEQIYDWLYKTCPSKKPFDELVVEMKKKFIELELPLSTEKRPSAIWHLALTHLSLFHKSATFTFTYDATILKYEIQRK